MDVIWKCFVYAKTEVLRNLSSSIIRSTVGSLKVKNFMFSCSVTPWSMTDNYWSFGGTYTSTMKIKAVGFFETLRYVPKYTASYPRRYFVSRYSNINYSPVRFSGLWISYTGHRLSWEPSNCFNESIHFLHFTDRRFIADISRHWSLFWVTWIQVTLLHRVPVRPILLLTAHLSYTCHVDCFFPLSSPEPCMYFFSVPCEPHSPSPQPPWFELPKNTC